MISRYTSGLLMCGLFLFVVSQGAFANPSPKAVLELHLTGDINGDFESNVTIAADLQNQGGSTLRIVYDRYNRREGMIGQFTYTVRNNANQIVPFTAYGRTIYAPDKMIDGCIARSWTSKEISTGQQLAVVVPLSRIVDISLPGDYSVKMTYHSILGSPATVIQSNVLHFAVIDGGDRQLGLPSVEPISSEPSST